MTLALLASVARETPAYVWVRTSRVPAARLGADRMASVRIAGTLPVEAGHVKRRFLPDALSHQPSLRDEMNGGVR